MSIYERQKGGEAQNMNLFPDLTSNRKKLKVK